MNFETYLASKKIDSSAFKAADPDLWTAWSAEFLEMHPTSFTAQKLYLINPVRRLYLLPVTEKPVIKAEAPTVSPKITSPVTEASIEGTPAPKQISPKPAVPRPVFKPKPKTD